MIKIGNIVRIVNINNLENHYLQSEFQQLINNNKVLMFQVASDIQAHNVYYDGLFFNDDTGSKKQTVIVKDIGLIPEYKCGKFRVNVDNIEVVSEEFLMPSKLAMEKLDSSRVDNITIRNTKSIDAVNVGDMFLHTTYNKLCMAIYPTQEGKDYIHVVGLKKENTTECRENFLVPIEVTDDIINEFMEQYMYADIALGHIVSYFKEFCNGMYLKLIKAPKCPHCDNFIIESVGGRYTLDSQEICCDCYYKAHRECERCGNNFNALNADDGEYLCESCRPREFILPYHRYTPPLKFFGNTQNNTMPYLGVELEVDKGGYSDNHVKQIMRMVNNGNMFIYCSSDSSLNDGFEIITQPATLNYHKSIKTKYEQAFEYLLDNNYLSHDTDTCGLHVHFNRNFFKEAEEENIAKLLYLVERFWGEFLKFSRRNAPRMELYSKKIDMPHNRYISRTNKTQDHDYHRYSVNLINTNTIEFRMFKGTLNIDTFLATLELVNNCIVVAKQYDIKKIQSMRFEDLLTSRVSKKYWKRRTATRNTEE